MSAIPIATREAQAVCRRARTYHSRWIAGLAGVAATLVAIWFSKFGEAEGESVFNLLGIVAECYALFAGVIVASDVISSERRENTLGLLFLTDLKARDVLAGKFMACAGTAFFGLFAFVPLLAIPQLTGGAPFSNILLLAVHLANTLFFSVAIGMLVSALFRDGWKALGAGLIGVALLGIGLPVTTMWFPQWEWTILAASPTSGLFAFWDHPPDYRLFWASFAVTQVLGWLSIGVVSGRLATIWRDRVEKRPARKVSAVQLRRRLLDENPLSWLANRDVVSSAGLLGALFLMFGTVLVLWLAAPEWRFDVIILWLSVMVLALAHAALLFRICAASAHDLAEDRASGALEMLLSTPLKVDEILRGRWLGLMRQFFGPATLVGFAHLIFFGLIASGIEAIDRETFFSNLAAMRVNDSQLIVLVVAAAGLILPINWIAAGWLGMWLGVRLKKSATAVLATALVMGVVPWLALAAAFVLGEATRLRPFIIPDESFNMALLLSAYTLGLVNAAMWMHHARRRLYLHFRAAAADRFGEHAAPIQWSRVVRILRTPALAVSVIAALAFLWLANVNERGERALAEAWSEHGQLALRNGGSREIPDSENLAQSELLRPLNDPDAARETGPRRPEIYRLKNPFSGRPPAQGSGWINPPMLGEDWARGEFVRLESFEKFGRKAGIFTNKAGSAAEAVLGALAPFEPTFQELRAAAEARPKTRFSREDPQLYQLANMLALKALASLRAGDSPAAEVLLILRLGQGVQHLSAPLNSTLSHAFQPLFEGLAQHRWNETQLRRFEKVIGELNLWERRREKIQRMTAEAIEMPARNLEAFSMREVFLDRLAAQLYPQGWVDETKAEILRIAGDDFRAIFDESVRRIYPWRGIELYYRPEKHSFLQSSQFVRALFEELREFAKVQATLDEILIACALERHRLEQGRFPDRLEELAAFFMKSLPHDVCSGEPMIYKPTDDRQQYILYSVGWDGRDNGGALTNSVTRPFEEGPYAERTDWVWRSAPM